MYALGMTGYTLDCVATVGEAISSSYSHTLFFPSVHVICSATIIPGFESTYDFKIIEWRTVIPSFYLKFIHKSGDQSINLITI